jgi:integrase
VNHKYFIKKNKSETSNINIRFWDSNRFDKTAVTGLFINFDDWNKNKQQIKNVSTATNKDFINTSLRELANFLITKYTNDTNTQQSISDLWLKQNIGAFFNKAIATDQPHKIYFLEWIDNHIKENSIKENPITDHRRKRLSTVKEKIIKYQLFFKVRLKFQDLNMNFYNNFLSYCKDTERLNNNTIGSYIMVIRKFCREIEIEGLPISPDHKNTDFKTISNETNDIYLTENEINKIFEFDFTHNERLENARDFFIIGLWTGLRVSDFLRLEKTHLKNDLIEIKTQKTKTIVVIPIHEQIKKILLKRNGNFPRKISSQKLNDYVKELCQIIGFDEMIVSEKRVNKKDDKTFFTDQKFIPKNKTRNEKGIFPKYELISSHICRRSFATNLYGKIPNMTIMAVTGHKTETQFLKYIKVTPRENAEKLNEYWQQQENKG